MMVWRDPSRIGLIIVVLLSCTMNGYCQLDEDRYNSMESYEDLLKMQVVLIESFENLLKNTTFDESVKGQSYEYLDSFDDLAMRQQLGLYSFEDVVSVNWSELDTQQRINLTRSYEDLLRSEAIILSSNEDLLKREWCKMSEENQTTFLGRFEDRLKYEKLLLSKFEDWLHYQQTIELMDEESNAAWFEFLSSFEDLIRRQSNLLSSFEDLMKFRCDESFLTLAKNVRSVSAGTIEDPVIAGQSMEYRYTITNNHPLYSIQNISIEDSILGIIEEDVTLAPGQSMLFSSVNVPKTLVTAKCTDCTNCICKVCNWAWACGEVVTQNGNFTICVNSEQICRVVDDTGIPFIPFPGAEVAASADMPEVAVGAVAQNSTSGPLYPQPEASPVMITPDSAPVTPT